MIANINSIFRNRYVLCAVAIAITYLLFSVLPANKFVKSLLRGDQYRTYYLAYIPALFTILCLYMRRRRSYGKVGSIVFGAFFGYLAGLGAYILVVFSMGGGLVRLQNSAEGLAGILLIFSAPLLYLSWAFGAFSALTIYLFEEKLRRWEIIRDRPRF